MGLGTLYFMCGKMAAGKSTLAAELTSRHSAICLGEDDLLSALFLDEINDITSYLTYSAKLKSAIGEHICALLRRGVPVVLDFPANTRDQRAWFRRLILASGAPHELHFIDLSDETCKEQLRKRNREFGDRKMQTEATFDLLSGYFDPPSADEAFNVVTHIRA